ncbi:MAG: FlgD immunoglobulin-like domain containing protein [Candidatus Zixiibacteriota bacterium]
MKSSVIHSRHASIGRRFGYAAVVVASLSLPALSITAAVVQVALTPPVPVAGSPFHVTIDGYFPDLCWSPEVAWSSISVVGNVLTIAIIGKDNWVSGPCLTAIAPYKFTQAAPPLPAGRYTLAVVEYHNSSRDPDPQLFLYNFGVDSAGTPTDVGDGDVPIDFTLDQNYPNPFNPSTVIEYMLPVTSHVSITIFNLLGQEVRKLVDETQSAGPHKLKWDGRDNDGAQMASGAYFYRLVAGDLVATKKMVLVR